MNDTASNEFERAASKTCQGGLLRDVLGWLNETKKWWLLPVLIVTLLLGFLIFLSGTPLAPFIYTLF